MHLINDWGIQVVIHSINVREFKGSSRILSLSNFWANIRTQQLPTSLAQQCWELRRFSPGDNHFWIYDDVTDNCILNLQRKSVFATLLLRYVWFLSFMPWDHALFLTEHQRNMWSKRKMACVSATQRKICLKWIQRLFLMHSDWREFWILENFRCVIICSSSIVGNTHAHFGGTSEEHVKQKKDGVRLCNAEKDLPKVNSTVVFDAFWLERVLNSWKFQVCNNFFWFWKNYSEVQE